MSWAADEWKVDLSHRALQKVEQLEGQLNRLKKEAEMKQFKLDSMEQVVLAPVILFGHFYCLIWESFPIQKWPLFSQCHVF